MLDAQLGKDVCGVEAGIVAELAGDYFEGFGEGFDYRLLFAGDGEVGGAVEVRGDFHLWEMGGQFGWHGVGLRAQDEREGIGEGTSHAPPPATMLRFRMARLTIIMASWRLRSTSAMNCSAPPLRTRVHVFAAGHPSKKLNLSPPI